MIFFLPWIACAILSISVYGLPQSEEDGKAEDAGTSLPLLGSVCQGSVGGVDFSDGVVQEEYPDQTYCIGLSRPPEWYSMNFNLHFFPSIQG